ncbi:MAG: zf-HC2 domain-containing protein [Clostridia bacterium]
MRCSEAKKQLSAYIDDMLEPIERHKVQCHLDKCKDCRTELADLKTTVSILRESKEISLPLNFHQNVLLAWSTESKIVNKFSNARIAALGAKRKNNWWNIGIGVAAIVATIFIGNSFLSDSLKVPMQKSDAMLAADESSLVGASALAEKSITAPALASEKKAGNIVANSGTDTKIAKGNNAENPAQLQQSFGEQAPTSSAGTEKATLLIENAVSENIGKFLVQARDGITRISNVEILLANSSVDSNKIEQISLDYQAVIINEVANEITIMLNQIAAAQLVDVLVTDKTYLINNFIYNVSDLGGEAISNSNNSLTDGVNSETLVANNVIIKFIINP